MAGKRIPDLDPLSGAASANDDKFVVYDVDAGTTKRMDRSQVAAGLVGDLPYTPSGGISATTVPTAIAELDSEAAKSATLAASSGTSLVGHIATGAGAVARTVQSKLRDTVNVRDFGAVGDGVADDQPAFAAAATAAAASNAIIHVPAGKYRFNSPLNITSRSIVIQGVKSARADLGGSEIWCNGCDAIIYGSDNGDPWSDSDYDGFQGQILRGLLINQGVRDTNLLVDPGTNTYQYKAGTKGITDWRGGDIDLDEVAITGFEYNFFGVQSDINCWGKVTSTTSKYGIYAGPRSDQFHIEYLYSFFCDRAITLDQVDGFSVSFLNIVACGGDAVDPVEIRRGVGTAWFTNVWGESFGDLVGQKMRSIIGVGTVDGYASDTTPVAAVNVGNVTYYGPSTGSKILGSIIAIGAGKCEVGTIQAFRGSGLNNVDSLVLYPADQTATGANCFTTIGGPNLGNLTAAKLITKLGSGSPVVLVNSIFGTQQFFESTSGFGIVVRERSTDGTINRRLQISNGNLSQTVEISRLDTDSATSQQRRLFLRRSIQTASAMPTSGAWNQGDFVINDSPSVLGTAGSRYILHGWTRLTNGSNHVLNTDWAESRTLTGT